MSTHIRKLVQLLQNLKTASYISLDAARQSDAKADKLLNLIFKIGLENPRFEPTLEEKKTIGDLLVHAIEPIQRNIEQTTCVHRRRLESSILRKRSALQFLVDIYGPFPAKGRTFSNKLVEANIQVSILTLDKLIQRWQDREDSDDPGTDNETSGIPSSHTWWFH